jgi:NDP-sugar pyrophosphorylase family protein
MRAVGGSTPKALLPVGKQTFIDYQLQWLKLLGVNEVILALGHEGKVIEEHILKNKNLFPKTQFSYDGPVLLGTGGAIKKAQSLLAADFMVLYGDSFLFIDLKRFHDTHKAAGRPLTMSIFENLDEGDRSNVVYRNGHIEKYDKIDHPLEMEYIDYGLSYLNKDYFIKNSSSEKFDLAEYMAKLAKGKKATAYVAREIFHEVGSPTGYQRFLTLMKDFDFNLEKLALAKLS